jgi:hypothetical protein
MTLYLSSNAKYMWNFKMKSIITVYKNTELGRGRGRVGGKGGGGGRGEK